MDELVPLADDVSPLLVRLLITLGLGFLIGLEREYAKRVVDKEEPFAGVRTYTFIALLGFIATFLAERYGQWLFVIALAALAALVVSAYARSASAGNHGITSELSAILTFLLGAVVFNGHILLGVIATVIVTTLLSMKLPLHRFVTTLTPQDIHAFIQFVVISAVVLPFLPDEQFGPYDVWNLRDIWTMVILVVSISLVGYLLLKILGSRGTLLTGIIGGLVSSTAVALSLSRRTKEDPKGPAVLAATGIIAASTIMFPRVLLEAWVLRPEVGQRLLIPVAVITAVGFLAAYLIHRKGDKKQENQVALQNPLNLGVAIKFALVFMAVQWLVAFAFDRYGTQGIYIASVLSGATDVDAITLSISGGAKDASLQAQAAIAILLATLTNTLVKFLIVLFLGSRPLRAQALMGFSFVFGAGAVCVLVLALGA